MKANILFARIELVRPLSSYLIMNQLSGWKPLEKPGKVTESRLIRAILDGTFEINSSLPGERALADMLGVTRPTLREALQRLERDGWLEIRHGKPTRVRDFWKEGKLGVSIALAEYQQPALEDFTANLLEVRVLLAPAYTSSAVENAPAEIADYLQESRIPGLNGTPEAYAKYDWGLHWLLTVHSGNPFFTHFINSVEQLYEILGKKYYQFSQTRDHSRKFYKDLRKCASNQQPEEAGRLAAGVMNESCELWKKLVAKVNG